MTTFPEIGTRLDVPIPLVAFIILFAVHRASRKNYVNWKLCKFCASPLATVAANSQKQFSMLREIINALIGFGITLSS